MTGNGMRLWIFENSECQEYMALHVIQKTIRVNGKENHICTD
jgi:hypothetical protein